MTTLTNPTDDELNEAFARYVANWADIHYEQGEDVDIDAREIYPWAGLRGTPPDGQRRMLFKWTESMDAVLPWLNKWPEVRLYDGEYCTSHCVVVTPGGDMFEEVADTLPRACALALLKAHGVEVVYDATSV